MVAPVRKLRPWQAVAALAAALFAFAGVAPDLTLPWYHLHTFGFTTDPHGEVITGVTPGSGADRAGLRAGQRIDNTAMRPDERRWVPLPGGALPGTTTTLAISTGRGTRRVSVRADTLTPVADNATSLLYTVPVLTLIVIATVLLLLRPSRMMWAFFWYAVMASGNGFVVTAALPFSLFVPWWLTVGLLYDFAWVPLTVFALRFPRDEMPRRSRAFERLLYILVAIAIPFAVFAVAGSNFLFVSPAAIALNNAFLLTQTLGFLVVLAAFIVTYRRAGSEDRARIRWVLIAFVVGYFGSVTASIVLNFPILGENIAAPVWLANILSGLNVLVPLAVAYAILRHRVFDVRVVVSRAVVLAVLTFVLVVTIALADYAIGKVISGTRLAAIAELAFAVGIGVSLNAMHERLGRFVEKVLYRRRGRALQRLQRVGRSLIQAPNDAAVTRLLVAEPLDGFQLASAAVFRRAENSGFVRVDAIGWDGIPLEKLDDGDSVVMQLRAERLPLRISEASWGAVELPDADRSPAIAMPVVVRSEVYAIVFYGAHRSGEDLDSEEIAALDTLLAHAAAAYDHLSAELARAELALLHDEVRRLQEQLRIGR